MLLPGESSLLKISHNLQFMTMRSFFLVWKEEAFSKWNEWIRLYEEDEVKSPESAEILKFIRDVFYLMTIVDNDYVNPQAREMIKEFINSI